MKGSNYGRITILLLISIWMILETQAAVKDEIGKPMDIPKQMQNKNESIIEEATYIPPLLGLESIADEFKQRIMERANKYKGIVQKRIEKYEAMKN